MVQELVAKLMRIVRQGVPLLGLFAVVVLGSLAADSDLFAVPTALLCSEPTAKHCHRRVVVEYLDEKWNGVKAVHL